MSTCDIVLQELTVVGLCCLGNVCETAWLTRMTEVSCDHTRFFPTGDMPTRVSESASVQFSALECHTGKSREGGEWSEWKMAVLWRNKWTENWHQSISGYGQWDSNCSEHWQTSQLVSDDGSNMYPVLQTILEQLNMLRTGQEQLKREISSIQAGQSKFKGGTVVKLGKELKDIIAVVKLKAQNIQGSSVVTWDVKVTQHDLEATHQNFTEELTEAVA